MPIEAGKYDSSPAAFYQKVTTFINREPIQDQHLFYTTWIRFPFQSRSGFEAPVVKQMQSAGQIIVRVRRDPMSLQIDPSMHMVHDGKIYGVICINPIPSMERDEIELLMQYQLPSSMYN